MKTTHSVFVLLIFFFPSLLKSQPESSTTSPSSLPGPCRSWLFPCGEGTWTCTTEEQYWRFRYGPQPGCPAVYPQTTAPPPGDCHMVNGVCQFTNASLECTTWLNTCQGYQCGTMTEYSAFLAAPGAVCTFGGQYPQPDDVCLPINGTCQWYNPCRSWRGFCLSGYNCGTADQYYQFLFGPQPLCALPPPGWVEPDPPGECAVRNGQCDWYNCTAWLDWCRTFWTCGTQYEEDIYLAGPPPPCPAPPPGYQPPPQPGMCQFNVSAGQCQFMANSTNTCLDGTPMVSCFSDPCGECPNYPNARCEANYCGGCNAVYYDERGNNVTDLCGTVTTSPPGVCPDGTPMVSCFSDPCGECPNYPNARCEANYCGGCNALYYDERGNNVTDYCTTYTGCEVILCAPGSKCIGNPVTGSAYCDPSCEEPYFMHNCGDEQRCTLIDGECPSDQSGPCPHRVRCIDIEPGCEAVQCSYGSTCVTDPDTGSASCVASCEESISGCRSDQFCRIEQYNFSWCDPSPCQYPVCYNAPYVPCSSTNVRAKCVANSRCLVQNKTQAIDCVQSCFENNGGCDSDQVCVNAVQGCSDTYGPYECSSQVQCLQLNDISPRCPAGWEYNMCGSTCGSDCESVLAREPVACPAVCYNGCFCPRGLVAYRDRCVDPRECYALLNSPPPANPLPVKPTTVLLAMTLPGMTSEEFKNKTQQFLNSVQQLLQDSGYSSVAVTIHAVYFDGELQVVVKLSGDQISAAKASKLVSVVNNNAASLSVEVKNVVAVPTQVAPSEENGRLSVGAIVGIVVAAVVVLMLAVVLVALVVVILLKYATNKQIRQQEFSNDMIYSKLSNEKSDPILEDAVESSQDKKEAL